MVQKLGQILRLIQGLLKLILLRPILKILRLIIKADQNIILADWDFSYENVIEADLSHIEANVLDLILDYCGPFNGYYGQCSVDIKEDLILLKPISGYMSVSPYLSAKITHLFCF